MVRPTLEIKWNGEPNLQQQEAIGHLCSKRCGRCGCGTWRVLKPCSTSDVRPGVDRAGRIVKGLGELQSVAVDAYHFSCNTFDSQLLDLLNAAAGNVQKMLALEEVRAVENDMLGQCQSLDFVDSKCIGELQRKNVDIVAIEKCVCVSPNRHAYQGDLKDGPIFCLDYRKRLDAGTIRDTVQGSAKAVLLQEAKTP